MDKRVLCTTFCCVNICVFVCVFCVCLINLYSSDSCISQALLTTFAPPHFVSTRVSISLLPYSAVSRGRLPSTPPLRPLTKSKQKTLHVFAASTPSPLSSQRKRRGDPHHNHDRHGGHGRILGARLVRCRCAALPWTGSRRIVRGVSVVVRCALLGVRGLERA